MTRFRAVAERGDGRKHRRRYALGTYTTWEEARLAEIEFRMFELEQERAALLRRTEVAS